MLSDRSNLLILSLPNANNLPCIVDSGLTQITPFVFVADEETVRQCHPIFSNDINCLLNVACELPQILFPAQCHIESIKYPIEDVPNYPAVCYFDIIADRIADNVALNRRTLVYCHYGRSRSITFILAYLIKYHRLPLTIAYKIVQDQRKSALPNIGFWTQLKLYELYYQEKKPLQKLTVKLKDTFIKNPVIRTNEKNRKQYAHSCNQICRRV